MFDWITEHDATIQLALRSISFKKKLNARYFEISSRITNVFTKTHITNHSRIKTHLTSVVRTMRTRNYLSALFTLLQPTIIRVLFLTDMFYVNSLVINCNSSNKTTIFTCDIMQWRSKGGSVRPGRHFLGGGKIEVIPKNLEMEKVF